MDEILSISNLSVAFSKQKQVSRTVLNQFHCGLRRGSCMGLVGESGSGKTLSALSILQLLPETASVSQESRILFRDQNLLDLSEKQMRRVRGKHIGMIFQDAMSAFNPVMTIGQQLYETIRLHLTFTAKESKARALFLLEQMGIVESERCYRSYPHELSGGMRQRAMIALALCAEPEIIIADEPTTALDVTVQAQVIELLNTLKKEGRCALLFIGHDLSVVSKIADDITVLKKGEIIEQNTAKQFFLMPTHEYSKQLLAAVLPAAPRKKVLQSDSTQPLLSVENLKLYFKKTIRAVDDVSFAIHPGETVALVGESGSGKTTTAKAILQLLKNTDGKIMLGQHDLTKLSARKLRKIRPDLQIIFQDPYAALNPRMTIFDSLCEGLLTQKKVRNKKQAEPIINAILKQVGLSEEIKSRYPHEFSGGQRQRICIARALTLSPKLLVLDEPTSALDVSTQQQVLQLLDKLQEDSGISYLLITHNLSVVAYLAHRVAVMYQGKIVEYGSVNDILTSPKHTYTQKLLSAAIM